MSLMNLLRALFPTWNFFDRVQFQFGLEFKTAGSSQWQSLSFDQPRGFFNLIFNVSCNEALAQVNVIEHFAREVQELQLQSETLNSRDVQRMTSFKMLRSLLLTKLSEWQITTTSVQFKIIAWNLSEQRDIYVSDWLSLS